MKQVICIIFGLTMVLLFATNSMYVEWEEIYIMVGCLSAISIIYNLFLKERNSYRHILGSSVFIGFFFSLLFSLTDLVFDHHKVITGVPDGRFLTLGETISEFSDDLFIIALIVMSLVALISFSIAVIYSKMIRKIV